jgi:hypothetical protein
MGPARKDQVRREQMLKERAQASPLRDVFPQAGQLRVELNFSDPRAQSPSPQVHTLYPAAPAFFRFPCPCADCDGDFDLTAAVQSLLTGSSARQRTLSGQASCDGARFRGPADTACSMQLTFRLASLPAAQ